MDERDEALELDELDEALFGASEPKQDRPRRRPSGGPTTPQATRRLILLFAALAGVAALPAGGEPAGWWPADVFYSAMFAALLTVAASRSRRWTWLVASGAAVAGSPDRIWFAVTGAALVLALVSASGRGRSRLMGAAIGALAAQGLLRLDVPGPTGTSAAIAAAVAGIIFISAYRASPRRVQKKVHFALAGSGVVVLVALAALGASATLAQQRVGAGVTTALDGLDAAREGDADRAAQDLREAQRSFESANDITSAWWALPARAVPVLGNQAHALDVSTGQGASLTGAAAIAAESVDVESFTFVGGRLDLAAVRQAQQPLEDAAAALLIAGDSLGALTSPWLLPPIRSRVDRLEREVSEAYPDAALAADLAAIGPALLGGDGDRTYFVAFTTPSESRGLGGFMGNWAELSAVDGKMTLTRSGRVKELNDAGDETRAVDTQVDGELDAKLADYVRRYDIYSPWVALQEVTLSPDAPTVGRVLEQLYPQSGGTEIDGVIFIDPFALAALMEFTGPIELEGLDRPLTAKNAAQFLLVDQYVEFDDREERADFLDEATRAVFEKLTTGDLPDPKEISEVLGPVVREGRLALYSPEQFEESVFEAAGIDGAMPALDGADFLSVVTQNGSLNKIDVYLKREIAYDVTFDPSTGALKAVLTITLTNTVPSLDLPDAVVESNDSGLPRGTNEVFLNVYTPHRLASALFEGQGIGVGSAREFDRRVYSSRFEIPAGESRVFTLALTGAIEPADRYRLLYASQPLVNDDEVEVTVRTSPGWEFLRGQTLEADPAATTVTWQGTATEDVELEAVVLRP